MRKFVNQANLAKLAAGLAVLISRFLTILPNFSLVGSFGFHSSSFLSFTVSFFVFDLIKGGFYPGFLFTYLGFFAYFALGRLAKNSLKKKIILLPLASLVFFLLSNFGVWWYWYPHTMAGLSKCYTLALPFYKNTLLSDLVFGWGYLVIRELGGLFVKKQLLARSFISNLNFKR